MRHGYTVPAGSAPEIEVIAGAPRVTGSNRDGDIVETGPEQYRVADRTFDNRADAETFRTTLTASESRFVPGVAPEGFQSAQTYVESDTERAIREMLEPASTQLTQRVIDDNIEGMPDAPRVQDRGTVAQSIFDRSFSLMKPGIDWSNRRLLNNLQARGLPIGGEAFNEAYGEQQRETQDTIARLAMDADAVAGQEQSRQFGLDSAARSTAISEIVAALGGGYNPFNSVPNGQAQPINYSGLVSDNYNARLANYNQQQQQAGATAGAIGSLGAALIKSTMTAKQVYGQVSGEWAADIMAKMPLAVWKYHEEVAPGGDTMPHIGPMAEHFKAMTGLGDGQTIHVIDYLGLLAGALQNALHRIEILERELIGEDIH